MADHGLIGLKRNRRLLPDLIHLSTLRRRAQLLQLRKFFFTELLTSQRVAAIIVVLEAAELDAADLAGNRLRQLRHQLDAPDALERRQPGVQMPEDRQRRLRRTFNARDQQHVSLGDGKPDRIGTWHDRGLRDPVMFEQDAFKLERADAVVRRLEDVIGTSDESQVALLVGKYHVASAIELAVGAAELAVIALIALHQARRTVDAEQQADLPFLGGVAVGVGDLDAIAGHWAAHRSDLDVLAGRISRQRGGLGLAVAVADRQPPRAADLIDHFGIERLAGAANLAQRHLEVRQSLLDEQ